jgi:hypothetical protein
MWEGIIAGFGVAGLHAAVAWMATRWGLRQSDKVLAMVVMVGMFARLVLIAAVSVVIMKFTEVPLGWYVGALIVGFLVFQFMEGYALLQKREATVEEED